MNTIRRTIFLNANNIRTSKIRRKRTKSLKISVGKVSLQNCSSWCMSRYLFFDACPFVSLVARRLTSFFEPTNYRTTAAQNPTGFILKIVTDGRSLRSRSNRN